MKLNATSDITSKIHACLTPAASDDSPIWPAISLHDSISTMLIYLSSLNISKFIHFVTNKLRLMDISGVFLAVEKGLDPMFVSQLTTFVDHVIDSG
jgi:hypothetical protein